MNTSRPVAVNPARSPRPPKTALIVVQSILTEIADNDLEAGTRLPPEHEMLASYGVSRGTLRESLRFLDLLGVLSIKPGPKGGPIVNPPHPRQLAGVLAILLQLSHTTLKTVLEVREMLEPALTGLAAKHVTDDEAAALARSSAAMTEHIRDFTFFVEENHRFHAIIAHAADNPVLELLVGSLRWLTDATAFGIEYAPAQRRSIAAAHELIAAAIAARDPIAASDAMRQHLSGFRQYLYRNHRGVASKTLRWEHRLG